MLCRCCCCISFIFVDVHYAEFCCSRSFSRKTNCLNNDFFGKKLLCISYQQNLIFKSMSGWKNYYALTRFSFLFAHMKANTMWWRKKYLHKTFTNVFAYCNADRYVIVTRYFVLGDIFREVLSLNIFLYVVGYPKIRKGRKVYFFFF